MYSSLNKRFRFFIHSGGDVAIAEVLSARISQFGEML